jgi:formylglycine-generating enzyme required for sulfatase activity
MLQRYQINILCFMLSFLSVFPLAAQKKPQNQEQYLKQLAIEHGNLFIAQDSKIKELIDLYAQIPNTEISPDLVKLIKQIKVVFDELQKNYDRIIQSQDQLWKIPAMYQVAWMKLSYANALRQIAFNDSDFGEETQIIYKKFLKERVDPVENSGVKYLIQTYEKALELNVNNQWTDKTAELLIQYQISPQEMKKKKEQSLVTTTPIMPHVLQNITWKKIPGGIFQMGSESGAFDTVPVHTVRIKEFCLSRSEITVGQYKQCVQAGVCTEPKKSAKCYYWENHRDQFPVNCVSWFQARTFAKWAGGDLPSEAEWEYAATSAGKRLFYGWGTTEATCQHAWMYDEKGFSCGTNRAGAVCLKPKGFTEQGLCDMAGNVGEWVLDEYKESYHQAPRDGSAYCSQKNCEGNSARRVDKGGDYSCGSGDLKAQLRNRSYPTTQQDNLGFRVKKNCILIDQPL